MKNIGHGDHHADTKHREAVFNRLRNELLREGSNPASFTRVKAKVLASRELQGDAELQAMIRAYIAEREAAFRSMHSPKTTTIVRPVSITATRRPTTTAAEAAQREARYHAGQFIEQFRERIRSFQDAEAMILLDKIRRLAADHPDIVTSEQITTCMAQLQRMTQRRNRFLQHVSEVADHAVAASARGDHDSAARALRRLTTVHMTHSGLLPDGAFDAVRERIIHAHEERDLQDAARRLVERERAVAADLKQLAERLHRFHAIALSTPHDSTAYRRAEADYRAAVEDIRHHDADWLAGVIFELVELLNDLHDPPPEKADRQVDRFLNGVRRALQTLRREASVKTA